MTNDDVIQEIRRVLNGNVGFRFRSDLAKRVLALANERDRLSAELASLKANIRALVVDD